MLVKAIVKYEEYQAEIDKIITKGTKANKVTARQRQAKLLFDAVKEGNHYLLKATLAPRAPKRAAPVLESKKGKNGSSVVLRKKDMKPPSPQERAWDERDPDTDRFFA